MKIILSPAKKMIVDTDNLAPVELPVYIDKTAEVLNWMKSKSKEELKAIWKCNGELSGDKLVTKGTYAKMARGEMVRFIAENNIENPVEIQKFDRLGYSFRSDLSSDSEYVFERKIK